MGRRQARPWGRGPGTGASAQKSSTANPAVLEQRTAARCTGGETQAPWQRCLWLSSNRAVSAAAATQRRKAHGSETATPKDSRSRIHGRRSSMVGLAAERAGGDGHGQARVSPVPPRWPVGEDVWRAGQSPPRPGAEVRRVALAAEHGLPTTLPQRSPWRGSVAEAPAAAVGRRRGARNHLCELRRPPGAAVRRMALGAERATGIAAAAVTIATALRRRSRRRGGPATRGNPETPSPVGRTSDGEPVRGRARRSSARCAGGGTRRDRRHRQRWPR